MDIEGKPKEGRDAQNDFETTVFIGNLPFIVSEEDVRKHFLSSLKQYENEGKDPILNVRLIRDPQTFVGKGIGYIQFTDKESMRQCIEDCHEAKFMGRPLRVKKAVEPKRLDKKKRGKEERAKAHAEGQKLRKEQGDKIAQEKTETANEIDKLRNFEQNAYGDKSSSKVPGISKRSKHIAKKLAHDQKEKSL